MAPASVAWVQNSTLGSFRKNRVSLGSKMKGNRIKTQRRQQKGFSNDQKDPQPHPAPGHFPWILSVRPLVSTSREGSSVEKLRQSYGINILATVRVRECCLLDMHPSSKAPSVALFKPASSHRKQIRKPQSS